MYQNVFDFRKLAWSEMQKMSRRRIVKLAAELVDGVRPDCYTQWGEPGIRAQLFDTVTRTLEMDFKMEGDVFLARGNTAAMQPSSAG